MTETSVYEHWVNRVAQALHDDCELEWQAISVADPSRQVTMHMADAHLGKAHDLVRRLGLAESNPTWDYIDYIQSVHDSAAKARA